MFILNANQLSLYMNKDLNSQGTQLRIIQPRLWQQGRPKYDRIFVQKQGSMSITYFISNIYGHAL